MTTTSYNQIYGRTIPPRLYKRHHQPIKLAKKTYVKEEVSLMVKPFSAQKHQFLKKSMVACHISKKTLMRMQIV